MRCYIYCKCRELLMTVKNVYVGMRGFWEDGVVEKTRNPAFHPDNSYSSRICLM